MPRRKVVSLAKRRVEPVPEVVAGLEDLVVRAKRGEVRGYVIATACDAGCDGTGLVMGDGNIATLVLSIERAKLRLLRLGED